MRFVYSAIRFVPDPARGEFVNVGVIVGSEDSSEWQVRQVGNPVRARALDERQVLGAVWAFLDRVGRVIDAHEQVTERLFPEPATERPSESWLEQLHQDHRNVVQLSPPTPMVASSADEALDRLFDLLVVDPALRRHRFLKKHVALAAIRDAYGHQMIRKGIAYQERIPVRSDKYNERFDFAVCNGRVLQLAQTWSFQIPDQDDLRQQVRAWGWAVRDLQRNGGEAYLADGRRLRIASDVDVRVVFVPPDANQPSVAMDEARNVFAELRIAAVPPEQAEQIGERAKELLTAAGLHLGDRPVP